MAGGGWGGGGGGGGGVQTMHTQNDLSKILSKEAIIGS